MDRVKLALEDIMTINSSAQLRLGFAAGALRIAWESIISAIKYHNRWHSGLGGCAAIKKKAFMSDRHAGPDPASRIVTAKNALDSGSSPE